MKPWPPLKTKVSPDQFNGLVCEDTLYEYAGEPWIFTSRDASGSLLLAYLCEEDTSHQRLIVTPSTEQAVADLLAGSLTTADALLSPQKMWVIDRTIVGDVVAAWSVRHEELPDDALPLPGVLLLPHLVPSAKAVQEFKLAEYRGNGCPSLDRVNRATKAFNEFWDSAVERILGYLGFDGAPLVPQAAHTGSYVMEAAVEFPSGFDGPRQVNTIIDRLNVEIGTREDGDVAALWWPLLDTLADAKLILTITPKNSSSALVVDPRKLKDWQLKLSELRPRYVDSKDVPQADELARIFRLVELRKQGTAVDADSLEVVVRQVSYYKRAAKILGLLDEDESLTAAGRLLAGLPEKERLRTCVVFFESSACGEAWIRWAKGSSLLDVTADSAESFLRSCAPSLHGDTIGRRAQTLRSWHSTLAPHHYALSQEPSVAKL